MFKCWCGFFSASAFFMKTSRKAELICHTFSGFSSLKQNRLKKYSFPACFVLIDSSTISFRTWWKSRGRCRRLSGHLRHTLLLMLPFYFNILFANKADEIVNTNPSITTNLIVWFDKSENKGNKRLTTSPVKDNFEISKKYPDTFSRLSLPNSLASCRAACCSWNFLIELFLFWYTLQRYDFSTNESIGCGLFFRAI